MKLNEAGEEIVKACSKMEDLEITFTSEGVDISWENLRVQCRANQMQKAIDAISTLMSLDASFQ